MTRQYRWSTANGYPPQQVFGAYDHFDDAALTKDWRMDVVSTGGSVSLASSILTINSGTGTLNKVVSAQRFGIGWMIESRCASSPVVGTNAHAGEVGLANVAINRTLRLYNYNNANWFKQADAAAVGQTTQAAMAQAADASYHIRRVWWAGAASAKYQVDNNAWEEITTNIPDGDLNGFFMSYASAGNTSTLSVDWVRVRRFAANDPTIGAPVEHMGGSSLTLTCTVTQSSTLARLVSSTLATVVSTTAALTKAIGAIRGASQSFSATVTRFASVARTATVAHSAALVKLARVSRAATTTLSATIGAVKVKLLTLTCAVTQSASLSRIVRATRAAAVTHSATVSKFVQATRAAVAAHTATLTKTIAKTIAATSALSALAQLVTQIFGGASTGHATVSDSAVYNASASDALP